MSECRHHAVQLDGFGVCPVCEATVERHTKRVQWRDVATLDDLPDLDDSAGVLAGDAALRMPRGEVTRRPGRIRRG